MAEFKEVMKEAKRMCEKGCHGCAFDGSKYPCEFLGDYIQRGLIIPEEFEDAVMKWAKEHPRRKYPTWREWSGMIVSKLKNPQLLFPCHFVDCKKDNNCDCRCYRLDEEIPEDFAIKANIQPLEK